MLPAVALFRGTRVMILVAWQGITCCRRDATPCLSRRPVRHGRCDSECSGSLYGSGCRWMLLPFVYWVSHWIFWFWLSLLINCMMLAVFSLSQQGRVSCHGYHTQVWMLRFRQHNVHVGDTSRTSCFLLLPSLFTSNSFRFDSLENTGSVLPSLSLSLSFSPFFSSLSLFFSFSLSFMSRMEYLFFRLYPPVRCVVESISGVIQVENPFFPRIMILSLLGQNTVVGSAATTVLFLLRTVLLIFYSFYFLPRCCCCCCCWRGCCIIQSLYESRIFLTVTSSSWMFTSSSVVSRIALSFSSLRDGDY